MMAAIFYPKVPCVQQKKSKPDNSVGKLTVCLLPFGIALIAADAMAAKADEVRAGKMTYESHCLGCHTVEANNIGPGIPMYMAARQAALQILSIHQPCAMPG